MNHTVGIIPARYASTRFPGKPLTLIKGKTMIQHVFERASQAASLSAVYVATDDQRIYKQVQTFTNKVVLVDEAQNLTKLDFEEIFTRVGKNSQLIFMGDDRQCKLPNKSSSGFRRMCELSNESDNVGFARLFTNFRSEIVEELLKKY